MRKSIFYIVIAFVATFSVGTSFAREQTIYKWTDADGGIHYDTAAPPQAAATELRVPLAPPLSDSEQNLNRQLQQRVGERVDRERAEREQRERARQEAERHAALLKLRAEQELALKEECARAGRTYCDDLEKIHANEMRRLKDRQNQRRERMRDAAGG